MQPRFDVARTLEETLFGIILLIWRYARTAWGFLFEPRAFDAACRDSTTDDAFAGIQLYARPLTFLTTSLLLTLWLGFIYSTYVIELKEASGFFRRLAEYLASLDLLTLVAVVFPGVVAVAAHAGITSVLARLMGCNGDYNVHLHIACYFSGTLVLAFPLMLLLQPPAQVLGSLAMAVYGAIMIPLVLRTIYRWVAMLGVLVAGDWKRAIALAAAACAVTAAASYAAYFSVRSATEVPGASSSQAGAQSSSGSSSAR
jgi:hypothetical protein